MNDAGQGRLGKRLGRILVMLPYAIRHPGVSIDELVNKFGVSKRDVLDDLNLVFLCGLPGYGPGDLIDVAFDEDRIYVRMADYFGAPLRLTPAEALALYAGGAALADLPGMDRADALRSALAKLGRALGVPAGGNGGTGIGVKVETSPVGHLDNLRRALELARRVRLEYHSASRGELTERVVEPWGLVLALGRWYLVGLDHLSEEERMFRLDRMKSVEVLDDPAQVPGDFDPDRYKGAFVAGDDEGRVSFEISPAAARWFGDYYPVTSSNALDDGWHEVTLPASGERWIATLLLRLGRDVRNVRPERSAERARDLAGAIAARYRP